MEQRNYGNCFEMFTQNIGLVQKFASVYSKVNLDNAVDYDDLIQVGYFAVAQALKTYTPEKGKFGSWMALYLKAAMRKAIGIDGKERPETANGGCLSLDEPISNDPDKEETLLDTLAVPFADPDEIADQQQHEETLCEVVHDAVGRLPDKMQAVINGCDLGGNTLIEMANEMGLSKQRISQIRYAAIQRMRTDEALKVAFLGEAVERLEEKQYNNKGIGAFRHTNRSVVEDEVLRNERVDELKQRYEKKKTAYENSNQATIDRIVKARGYSPELVARLQRAFA